MSAERRIITVSGPEQLAATAAERLIARIGAHGGPVAICLTGGSSPQRLYELLATQSGIPWQRVHWFIGDDRFVAPKDKLSNIGMAKRTFLDRLAPITNVHPIPTDAATPHDAALAYEATLKAFYGADTLDPMRPLFDLVLMGVGPDGHTASLFPNAPALNEQTRWVVGVDTANVAPFVPRVTLTLPALASSHEMLFLVSGAEKRAIVTRVLAGEDFPAGRAHALGETIWLGDRAALPDHSDGMPSALIVMGVSGSGKSTVAKALADRLGWRFEDGDSFHPPANVAKMSAGHPLNDDDRKPWLQAIAAAVDRLAAAGTPTVVACSALKRIYRDILVHGRDDIRIVYLKGTRPLVASRLAARKGHFMPPGLLDSQFGTLEEPGADENPVVVSIADSIETIVDDVVRQLSRSLPARLAASSSR